MGYYTIHKIRIVNEYNTRNNLNKLLDVIEKISGYTFYIIGSTIADFNNSNGFGTKWYECRHDLEGASRFFPEFEIQVKSKGEDGKVWEATYKDGNEYGYMKDSNYFSDLDENSYFDEEDEKDEELEEKK